MLNPIEALSAAVRLGITEFLAADATKSQFEKGSEPLQASRLHWLFGLAREGQPPFSDWL
jgi:hypothetical protein